MHTKRKKNKENNKYGLHGSKQCRAAAEDVSSIQFAGLGSGIPSSATRPIHLCHTNFVV